MSQPDPTPLSAERLREIVEYHAENCPATCEEWSAANEVLALRKREAELEAAAQAVLDKFGDDYAERFAPLRRLLAAEPEEAS